MLSPNMAGIQKHFTFRSRDLEFSKNLIFLWKIRNKYPVCEIYILRVVMSRISRKIKINGQSPSSLEEKHRRTSPENLNPYEKRYKNLT